MASELMIGFGLGLVTMLVAFYFVWNTEKGKKIIEIQFNRKEVKDG